MVGCTVAVSAKVWQIDYCVCVYVRIFIYYDIYSMFDFTYVSVVSVYPFHDCADVCMGLATRVRACINSLCTMLGVERNYVRNSEYSIGKDYISSYAYGQMLK